VVHVVLVMLGLASLAQTDAPAPSAADQKTYEALRVKAGRDPAALVKLALWCEAHDLTAERLKHLTEAVSTDPANVAGRGLLGLISYRGQWVSPVEVEAKRKSDQKLTRTLEAYYARRSALEASLSAKRQDIASRRKAALGHEKLGTWCEENGLKDEATAHFTTAVQLDPYHESAWRHLGYVKNHGRWLSREQLAADEQETAAQHRADRHWEALLKKWKMQLGDKRRQHEAAQSLAKVTDPRAVPAIMKAFGNGSAADQSKAVAMLRRIESALATRELARLAVFGESDQVRADATRGLRGREPRDYVGSLIAMVQFQVTYKTQPVQGPGSQGGLLLDTPRFTLLRTYDAPAAFSLGAGFRGVVGYDVNNGLPIVARGVDLESLARLKVPESFKLTLIEVQTQQLLAEANLKAAAAQQQMVADIHAIEASNVESAALNERVVAVLGDVAGAPVQQADQDILSTWWYDKLGYQYEPPPKVTVAENAFPQLPGPYLTTCFVAGTPVRTVEGFRPIEAIRTGDLVLSQDVTTGQLDFCPVLSVHHNAPNHTLRITLSNGDTLGASVYHRFWRPGAGWAQARELKPGDVLRKLGSTVRIISVEPGPIERLYNLDVAKNRSFFVGSGDVLVHDNTLPPARLSLFDALPNVHPQARVAE